MEAIAYYLREVGMTVETIQSQQGTTDLYQTRNYDIGYKGLSAFSIAEWYGEYQSTNAYLTNWQLRSPQRRIPPSVARF